MKCNPPTTIHRRHSAAFTIIELLCVITVLSILMALVGLGVPNAIASQRLSSAARQFSSDLNQATLLAKKQNRPVELRFYRLSSPTSPNVKTIRGYQMGVVTGWDADAKPTITFTQEIQQLPDGVVFMPDATFTTLFASHQDTEATPENPTQPTPYASYYLRSNGDATLPQQTPAVFTLVREISTGAPTTLPSDYRCVVIDPQQHNVRVY